MESLANRPIGTPLAGRPAETMTTEPPKPPDVRSKWTQRSMEIGFLFGAAFTAVFWLAAAFRYACLVAFGQEALTPEPIVYGIMASIMSIPIIMNGVCSITA